MIIVYCVNLFWYNQPALHLTFIFIIDESLIVLKMSESLSIVV